MTDLLHGRDDVGVGATAADIAVHGVLDVVIGWTDVLLQDGDGGHDLAGGAVAALVTIVLDERDLHWMKVIGLADAFDRCDLVGAMHHGEGEARVNAAAVDVDRTGSALTMVAALLGAGQVEVFAETIEKSSARVKAERMGLAVDLESQGYGTWSESLLLDSGWERSRRCCEYRRGGNDEAGRSEMREEGATAYAISYRS